MELDLKISQSEIEKSMTPLELDLVAFFKLLEEDIFKTIEANADASPDEIINQVVKLI
jgi:hypothetical protein